MSNIKSWADHCSSDEESDDSDRIAPPPSGLPGSTSYHDLAPDSDEEDDYIIPPRQFDIPTEPPFTAFLGNLHNELRTNNDLGRELDILLNRRRLEAINATNGQVLGIVRITSARLMIDKTTNTSRGYGYCEFDSPEEVCNYYVMLWTYHMLI